MPGLPPQSRTAASFSFFSLPFFSPISSPCPAYVGRVRDRVRTRASARAVRALSEAAAHGTAAREKDRRAGKGHAAC